MSNRQKYTLENTPIGYVHTMESILEKEDAGKTQHQTLSCYLYALSNDETTLICSDAGNGNYNVIGIYGISKIKGQE